MPDCVRNPAYNLAPGEHLRITLHTPDTADALAETEAGAQACAHALHHTAPPPADDDDPRRAVEMLAGVLSAAALLVVAGLIGFAAWRGLDLRIDALHARLTSTEAYKTCDAPSRTGDAAVIIIRRAGQQLLTRCVMVPGTPATTQRSQM